MDVGFPVPRRSDRGRWAFLMARQVVGNFVPSSLGADEDVVLRPDAGVVVEAAHWHYRDTAFRVEPRHR